MDHNPYRPSSASAYSGVLPRRSPAMLFVWAVGIPLAADSAVLFATGTTGRFVWLLQQAASLLIVLWPVSVTIACWAYYGYKTASEAGRFCSRRLLWLAPLIVIPMTTLVWGAVLTHPRGLGYAGGPRYVQWQLAVVHWALYASIAIGLLAVLFNGGRRAFVGASTVLLLLFSFSCSFTAASSVTGDWL